MKTKNYNIGKKLITLVIVALISTGSFATTKGNSNLNKNSEPVKTTISSPAGESKTEVLTETLHDWINNGSYWENNNSEEVSNSGFSNELSRWISDGFYRSEPTVKKEVKDKFTSNLMAYMENGCYWKSEK